MIEPYGNLLRVLVGELWMCLLAIWSAQIFKRKLSFLVGLGLFHLLSPPLQTVVALRPVAAVRGSSLKFPAFLEWKRYLSRTISSRTLSSFHGVQPFWMMQVLQTWEACWSEPTLCYFAKTELRDCHNSFRPLYDWRCKVESNT